ncbi:MAG: SPOR domain-containing protein [Magnetococcales bacterium]|nr:SPOR domain-containing protein [Magnetococcales bacterium]
MSGSRRGRATIHHHLGSRCRVVNPGRLLGLWRLFLRSILPDRRVLLVFPGLFFLVGCAVDGVTPEAGGGDPVPARLLIMPFQGEEPVDGAEQIRQAMEDYFSGRVRGMAEVVWREPERSRLDPVVDGGGERLAHLGVDRVVSGRFRQGAEGFFTLELHAPPRPEPVWVFSLPLVAGEDLGEKTRLALMRLTERYDLSRVVVSFLAPEKRMAPSRVEEESLSSPDVAAQPALLPPTSPRRGMVPQRREERAATPVEEPRGKSKESRLPSVASTPGGAAIGVKPEGKAQADGVKGAALPPGGEGVGSKPESGDVAAEAKRAAAGNGAEAGKKSSGAPARYAVQVAGGMGREEADRAVRELRPKGFAAVVVRDPKRAEEHGWRVRIGPFGNEKEAIETGERYRQVTGKEAVVLTLRAGEGADSEGGKARTPVSVASGVSSDKAKAAAGVSTAPAAAPGKSAAPAVTPGKSASAAPAAAPGKSASSSSSGGGAVEGGTRYVVQVGAFATKEATEALVAKLRQWGYRPVVEPSVDGQGRSRWSVEIGRFRGFSKADALRTDFVRQRGMEALVRTIVPPPAAAPKSPKGEVGKGASPRP